MAEHYHVRRKRLSSSGSDDFEDESLDPRIQVELEKLNKASEEINRLELELDDARAAFRQTLSESTQKLEVLAKKLGSCVDKARPYYDARVKAKDAHLETQRAALRFERACSMHEAAKEMVQLAEQGYMRREQPSDPAWQEMLNHATMKVNEAEKERNESERDHQITMTRFKAAEEQVQQLQKDLKRTITKSKPYFEMKAKFNQIMEEHKQKVGRLEEDVSSAKSLYSTALRSLEAISDDIHRQRLERRQQQQLGVRSAGVGAECPFPPPSWEKGPSIDGADSVHTGSCQLMDPLGVIKVPTTVSYIDIPARRQTITIESSIKINQAGDIKMVTSESSIPEPSSVMADGLNSDVNISASASESFVQNPHYSSLGSAGTFIGGDPLGVLPPTYSGTGVILHVNASFSKPSNMRQGSGISHPAYSGHNGSSRTTTNVMSISHPIVSHGVPPYRTSLANRSVSTSTPPTTFRPASVVYDSPEKARRASYRKAVENSQKAPEEIPDDLEAVEAEILSLPLNHPRNETLENEKYSLSMEKSLNQTSRFRSYSNPVEPVKTTVSQRDVALQSQAIPVKLTSTSTEVKAHGFRHGSAPERSDILTYHSPQELNMEKSSSNDGSPINGSPLTSRHTAKLQGLILRIDPSMDPLRSTYSVSKVMPPPAPNKPTPTTSLPTHIQGTNKTLAAQNAASSLPQTEPVGRDDSGLESKADQSSVAFTKPIVHSASMTSTAASEISEADTSDFESVSATQSPTKPQPRLLKVPTSVDYVEDNSDTESLASTGPMLDDEQVEFLTMDFSEVINKERLLDNDTYPGPGYLKRNSWSRMSLPPRLSYLEDYLARSKRLSGDFESTDVVVDENPSEEEKELDENVHSESKILESQESFMDGTGSHVDKTNFNTQKDNVKESFIVVNL